ncbi:hypothetical protein BJ170DRAFT_685523 [Xylariales sp. AK1849]|nr:hypothetical protein BJ170DRAFT_685523 [Xylariales sp. AK1849]
MTPGKAAGSSVAVHGVVISAKASQGMAHPQPVQTPDEEEIPFDESSDSDTSMSTTSDDDEGHIEVQDRLARAARGAVSGARMIYNASSVIDVEESRKRKQSSDAEFGIPRLSESAKKVKLDGDGPVNPTSESFLLSDRSLQLPGEIWQHIFTFAPPRTLGNLLQVNKLFSYYLDPSFALPSHPPLPSPLSQSSVAALQPDVVWQVSRRRYWLKLPTPLKDKSELDMWRLACMRKCQFCGKLAPKNTLTTQDKLNSSPGARGVNVIWPFAVRSCGSCLLANTTKEIDLLLSSSVPSVVLPALPFALITNDTRVISSTALENGQVPGGVQFKKVFLSKHVVEMREEFSSVTNLGTGTAEEWLKGLEDRGKGHRLDAARWERWDFAGGVLQMRALRFPGEVSDANSLGRSPANGISKAISSRAASEDPTADDAQALASYVPTLGGASLESQVQPIIPLSIDNHELLSRSQPSHPLQQTHQPRMRTREEVLEMKAARRVEIERRAMLLDPPLSPSVLAHIPSFQAALQLIHPLDDNAWDVLKPRLLAQRADAVQRESRDQETAARSRIVQERSMERRNPEGPSRESKELMDKDWDDAQAPLRAQISMYADETVRNGWDDGHKVGKDNSPRFAAHVLLYVRKRFYTEMVKAAAAARAAGQEPIRDPSGGPFTQKLTLENMKWLFDTKIKPHTEPYRKELFLCNGCEDNLKAYGFEGVIQHYAAKHTTALSLGSIVVHWRSEWPEVPPFHPNPQAKSSQVIPQVATYPQPPGLNQQFGFSPHPPAPFIGGPPNGHGATPYPNQYAPLGHQHHNGAFGPPGMYAQAQGPSYGQPYSQPVLPHGPAYNAPPAETPGTAGPQTGGIPPMPPFCPQQPRGNTFVPTTVHPGYNYSAYMSNGQVGYPAPPNVRYPDKVRVQLEHLAHNSRDVWMATAGVKELPGNIRVYVVLHHLARRYRSQFSESPPLNMFIDGLSNNKEMRPVRNVNGLMCKACHLGLGSSVQVEGERNTFSLPQLVNHFQHKHVELRQTMQAPLLDWTIDMVYVPDLSTLSSLWAMAGIDSHKYALITEAFPQIMFPGSHSAHDVSGDARTIFGTHASNLNPSLHSTLDTLQNFGLPQSAQYTVVDGGPTQDSGADYGLHAPNLHNQPYYSPEPVVHTSRLESVQPPEAYTPPQYASQRSNLIDSARNSPDVWQKASGKMRNRKSAAKDRRVTSGQTGKPRKGNGKGSMDASTKAAAKKVENEEDTLAEAEAQRQEDAIRAMWAADRVETARLASASTAPRATADSDAARKMATLDVQQLVRNRETGFAGKGSALRSPSRRPASPSSPVTQPSVQPHSRLLSPILIQDHEDDLFAGLESHLNQQRATIDYGVSRPNPLGIELNEPRLHYEQAEPYHHGHTEPERAPSRADQRLVYERDRLRSPPRIRYENQLPSGYYRQRSPVSQAMELTYTRVAPRPHLSGPSWDARPAMRSFDDTSKQEFRQGYYRSHHDEGRSRPAPPSLHHADPRADDQISQPILSQDRYAEAYELVLARDSQGEYYIKRPIRQDPERVYARYEDRPVYRESTTYRPHDQNQNQYQQDPLYEPALVHERYRHHEMPLNPESAPRLDPASYEEYDPRFPAAPSSTGPPRQVRYQ